VFLNGGHFEKTEEMRGTDHSICEFCCAMTKRKYVWDMRFL